MQTPQVVCDSSFGWISDLWRDEHIFEMSDSTDWQALTRVPIENKKISNKI